jgi:hypothetical protein
MAVGRVLFCLGRIPEVSVMIPVAEIEDVG